MTIVELPIVCLRMSWEVITQIKKMKITHVRSGEKSPTSIHALLVRILLATDV